MQLSKAKIDILFKSEAFAARREVAEAVYRLDQTCGACPEQYDVYRGDIAVARFRVRHGHFSADCGMTEVYSADVDGDGLFTAEERPAHLALALVALHAHETKMAAEIEAMFVSDESPSP